MSKFYVAITWKMYRQQPASWWIRQQVRARCDLTNGFMSIPAGSLLKIRSKRSGFNLSGPKCAHCGVKSFINKVSWNELELECESPEVHACGDPDCIVPHPPAGKRPPSGSR